MESKMTNKGTYIQKNRNLFNLRSKCKQLRVYLNNY